MNKVDKSLSITLNQLNVSKDLIEEKITFKNVDIFNKLVLNGISKQSLGNKFRVTDFFKTTSDNKRYFDELKRNVSFPIIFVDEEFSFDNFKFDVGLYIPYNITVLEFYEFLRNCLAHKNILNMDNKTIFFSSFAGKKNKGVATAWSNEIYFLLILEDKEKVYELAVFLEDYLNQQKIIK